MSIELKSLVGKHTLSGAFFDVRDRKEYDYSDGVILRFTLDGKHYEAVEDENDGYRSALGDLRETTVAPKNKFKASKVVAKMKENTEPYSDDEILQFINPKTGNIVMEIGTANASDYYPGFVASFSPENL